jgi:hypothetical protein
VILCSKPAKFLMIICYQSLPNGFSLFGNSFISFDGAYRGIRNTWDENTRPTCTVPVLRINSQVGESNYQQSNLNPKFMLQIKQMELKLSNLSCRSLYHPPLVRKHHPQLDPNHIKREKFAISKENLTKSSFSIIKRNG